MFARTADPYRDLSVIDVRAPRFNQATVGILSLVGAVTGWWGLFALLATQLSVGLALGRRWCLPCVFYFEVVQPRIGEGELEDSRPPRFANQVGAAFLWAATVACALGQRPLGLALGGVVATLAILAATTGFCAGCVLYRAGARWRGLRTKSLSRIGVAGPGVDPGPGEAVQFGRLPCNIDVFLVLNATRGPEDSVRVQSRCPVPPSGPTRASARPAVGRPRAGSLSSFLKSLPTRFPSRGGPSSSIPEKGVTGGAAEAPGSGRR